MERVSTRGLRGDDYLEAVNHNHRVKNRTSKLRALEIVGGGVVQCVICAESDPDMLTIDHVHDDGAQHRRDGARGAKIYWQLIRGEIEPGRLQILCANHNQKKLVEAWRDRRIRRGDIRDVSLTRDQVLETLALNSRQAGLVHGVSARVVRRLRCLYGLDGETPDLVM
jgi:hypothetical protein